MSDIFSHAPEPGPETAEPPAPVEMQVTIPATPEHAFLGWTEHIHLWWPLSEFSISGEDAYVDFEDRELVETSSGDQMISWGTVTDWDPPSLLVFSWHPGRGPADATEVRISIGESQKAGENGSVVRLEHRGWGATAGAVQDRAECERIWSEALKRYTRFMGGPG